MYTSLFGVIHDGDLSESFPKDFTKLISLNHEQIKKISKLLDMKDGFNIPDKSLPEIAIDLKADLVDLKGILNISKFIYAQIEEKKVTKKQLEQDLKTIAKHFEIELAHKNQKEIIELLFERKREYELQKQIRLYKRGIIPSIQGITTICDVRAVYESDSSKIATYLPVVIARISTIDDKDKEQIVTFQFSESSLTKAKEIIDKAIEDLNGMNKELKDKGISIYEENSE